MLGSRFLLVVALSLSIGIAGLACSDDDDGGNSGDSGAASDPLDVYFAELGVIGNEFLDSLVLQPQGLDTSAPIADQVDVYQTYLEGLSQSIEDAQEALGHVDKPAEVVDAHAVLVVSVDNALDTAEHIESLIGDINSSEDMQALANNQDILTALAEFRTACLSLKDIAEENEIDRVVRCE